MPSRLVACAEPSPAAHAEPPRRGRRPRYPAGVSSAAETLDLHGMAETHAPAQPAERDPDHPHPGQWRLVHGQVSNWGTFHCTHDVAASPKGFFLTGGPGTGQATSLDEINARQPRTQTLQLH